MENLEMETEVTEKVTMTQSEIEAIVKDKTKEAIEEFAKKSVEDKLGELSEEVKVDLGTKAKEILEGLKVSDEVKDAKAEVSESYKDPGEFLTSIIEFREKGKFDPRLRFVNKSGNIVKTAGHMEEGDDAQGGFLVNEVYENDLQMIALENSIVRPNGATVIPPIKTDSVKIPYVNDTTHASTVFGGVNAYWTAEAASKSASKPTFGQMELTPHKLCGITYLSHELRDDSAIALVPLIKRMFGSAYGYFTDDAFINGTGAGQPMGIQNCGALKTVFRNTVNQVYFEDIAEMYACMLPASHPYAFWVVNPGVLPSLIQMGTGNAAAASGKNVIWISKDMGASKGIPGTIFGRPFLISEKMPAFGSQGDIGYFDFRYYLIFDRQPITIDFSSHVAFTTDEDCWRFVLRVAGQCWPQTTLTPRNAGAPVTTISPFVVLAATTS